MKLWDLARRVYHEAIFQGQVASAGSNVQRLTERMRSNGNYIGKQGSVIQYVGSFYLLSVSMLSIFAFVQLRGGTTPEWNHLVTVASVGVQMLVQTGYLMMLTILATAEILAPELYRWFSTLPLSRDEVGSLRILALAREFAVPLAVIVLVQPFVAGFAGHSLPAALLGIIAGLEHGAVTLGLAVLASWKLRSVLRRSDADDRKARLARTVSMFVYGIGTVLVVFVMQIGSNALSSLYGHPAFTNTTTVLLARVLALLPLPTAPASLLALVVTGPGGSPVAVWQAVVGTVLYALAGFALLLQVRRIIRSDGAARRRTASSHAQVAASHAAGFPPLVVRSPRHTFRRQIGIAMTRDTQALISMIFPVLIPLISSVGAAFSDGGTGVAVTMGHFIASVMGGWLAIHGLTRLQFGSGGLEASLPIRERDRIFPRLFLVAALPTAGALLPPLVFLRFASPEQVSALVAALCVAVAGPAGMLVKLALFGGVGHGRVVLGEVKTAATFWKWACVLAVLLAFGAAIFFLEGLLTASLGALGYLVLVAVFGLVGLAEIVISRRLFP